MKIQKQYRASKFRKSICIGLKKLVLRKNLWRKFALKQKKVLLTFGTRKINEFSQWRKKLVE